MNSIKKLFVISRPISWVNTAFPFAAGYLVLGGGFTPLLVIGTLFFLIPYNLLMYGINDVFDYESDINNPRKGGIEGAVTPKSFHPTILWSSMLLSVPFIAYLLFTGSLVSNLTLTVVLFFVVAYSAKGLRFKEIAVLDSMTSSMHFVGPLLYAYSLLGTTTDGWLAAAAFFAWGIASQAFGAVQDIVPDREGGIRSIATIFGARTTVTFAVLLYMMASLLVAIIGGWAWLVSAAGLLYVANIIPFTDITDETSGNAGAGWKRFLWLNYVVGFIVTVALILSVVL